jgi:solute carrier family 6 GABA transporter-like protein 1
VIVGQGRNWKIPAFLPFLLRYLSGPVLAIILSFAFPEFHSLRYDPMMIAGFILSILGVTMMIMGLILPRYFVVFIPKHRRAEGTEVTYANELKKDVDVSVVSVPISEEEKVESRS